MPASDILPVNQTIGDVSEQLTGIPLHFPAKRRWLIAMIIASLLLALFVVSVVALFTRGVGIWGINVPVTWAFAIHNYVWWLGIGHAHWGLTLGPITGRLLGDMITGTTPVVDPAPYRAERFL